MPDLPLVLGTGSSKAEAVADLRDAAGLWLEDRKARSLAIPVPSADVLEIEVAASIA